MDAFFSIISAIIPIFGYLFGSSFNAISVSLAAARGAGHPMSLLLLLPTYAGQHLAGRTLRMMHRRSEEKAGGPIGKSAPATAIRMALPVLLHVASNVLYGAAISMAGSALYQVCYASAPVFSIVYTKLLLGKNTSLGRIVAVVVIIIGLIARVHVASNSSSSSSSSSPLLGAILTFGCAAGFSLGNILAERALNPPASSGLPPTKPGDYLAAIGGYGFILGGIVGNGLWTLPRWQNLVADPMASAGVESFLSPGPSGVSVAACLGLNMISSASLNLSYYVLVVKFGVVTMAVLSAMNTIIVSAISHALFCSNDGSAQCVTAESAVASLVVIAGVFMYAAIPSLAQKAKHE